MAGFVQEDRIEVWLASNVIGVVRVEGNVAALGRTSGSSVREMRVAQNIRAENAGSQSDVAEAAVTLDQTEGPTRRAVVGNEVEVQGCILGPGLQGPGKS